MGVYVCWVEYAAVARLVMIRMIHFVQVAIVLGCIHACAIAYREALLVLDGNGAAQPVSSRSW